MAENEAPPAKRMRYNLRSATETMKSPPHAYMLRSTHKIDDNVHNSIELPRKCRKPTLLSINPDCLLKIFEYMNPIDLSAMAETCSTLNNYAKYHFRLKYKHFDFASIFDGDLLSVNMAKSLFRIFGEQIHSLKISCDLFKHERDVSTELLLLTAKYCRHIVKKLTLDGFDFAPDTMRHRVKTLFNSVETLILENCCMCGIYLSNMKNLKVLKLDTVDSVQSHFLLVKFDKLEMVELKNLDICPQWLQDFVNSGPNIKHLSIVQCSKLSTSIFGSVKHLANLEEFEFQRNRTTGLDSDLMYLLALEKLKILKLNCNQNPILQLIDGFRENNIALEHLELAHGQLDAATMEAIVKLKTIKVLKLNDMLGFAECSTLPIAKELDLLEELHIKTGANISQFRFKEIVREAKRLVCLKIDAPGFDIRHDTFLAILTAVQKRTDQNHLAVTIYGDKNQTCIPEVVLKGANEKWLKINKFDRTSNHLFPPNDSDFDEDEDEYEDEDEDEFDVFVNGYVDLSEDEVDDSDDDDSDGEPLFFNL